MSLSYVLRMIYRAPSSRTIIALYFLLHCSSLLAGMLNISNNALEVVTNVEPNIVVVTDDSSSMDWDLMTSETEGIMYLGTSVPYYYAIPAPTASGTAPAVNSYFWVLASEEHLRANGVTYPYAGVWRARNKDYNKVYYDPDVTYSPWKGVDVTGAAFTDASPTAAPYDPYRPANGTIDLTTNQSYTTDCYDTECQAIVALSGVFTISNYFPARYYLWTDANATTPANANNGVVDADDDHTRVEIKPATASYTRTAYTEASGLGRSDCTDNGDGTATCTYAQEIQNFANWYSYYRKRDLAAKGSLSTAIETVESARIGYASINNSAASNQRVASMNISPNSGNKKALYDSILGDEPNGSTPLRLALQNTGRYFNCAANDIMGSTSTSAPGSSNCPVEASPAGECQLNFSILMTDGFWNGASGSLDSSIGDADANSGNGYDGGAFTDGNSITLADIAMHYYESDLQTTLSNDVPTTLRDINLYIGSTSPFETMHQHMATYTVGFGVDGTLTANPSDPNTAFSWPNPTAGNDEKIDDLRHAAYNGRGLFLSAANPTQLSSAISDIFTDIQSGTGTATAVAFNTQEIESGSLVFRASFNTKTHKGDLVAQAINSDGTIDPTIIWSAADKLDSVTSASSDARVIATYKDTGTSSSSGIPFKWGDLDTSSGGQQDLLNAPQPTNIPSATNTFGDERVSYLRGHSVNEGDSFADGEFRERSNTEGKLGDIVHSTPVYVGKPEFLDRTGSAYPPTDTYADFVVAQAGRVGYVYTGANDGMLHAFKANDGTELFGYVPNIVIENLSDLTNPSYVHQFYVDLTPSINDVYMTPTSGTNSGSSSWNTVLMGGLGAGGKGYYAINVTDPSDLDSEAELAANVLWEFSNADDADNHLGYSFSKPLLAMSNYTSGGYKQWVAIFGNGYNNTSTDGNAVVYILLLEEGQDGVWDYSGGDYFKVDTGVGKSTSSDGSTPNGIGDIRGIDSDGNGTVDYIYAGDLQGNLYRIDVTDSSPGDWETKLTPLFTATYGSTPQPITTRPIVVQHPDTGYLVIFSTGSWFTTDDASSTDIQSIYAIWDDDPTDTSPTAFARFDDSNQLVKQTFTNHVSTEHGFTVRTVSNNDVTYKKTGASSKLVRGWYIDLDMPAAGSSSGIEYPGERAVRNFQLRGDILFVNTVIPKSTTACSVGAGGFELALDPYTGGPGTKTIFDLNNDGVYDADDNVSDVDDVLNIVTGLRFDADTPTDSAFIGSRRMTQAGDEIRSIDTNTGSGGNTGRTSWREILPD